MFGGYTNSNDTEPANASHSDRDNDLHAFRKHGQESVDERTPSPKNPKP